MTGYRHLCNLFLYNASVLILRHPVTALYLLNVNNVTSPLLAQCQQHDVSIYLLNVNMTSPLSHEKANGIYV